MGLNKLAAFSCMSLTLACAGAAKADNFFSWQFITYSENDWGSGTASSSLLIPDFNSVFASTGDVLLVEVAGVANQYFMTFRGASNVEGYLPQTEPALKKSLRACGATHDEVVNRNAADRRTSRRRVH
jgi:hypothetical protein